MYVWNEWKYHGILFDDTSLEECGLGVFVGRLNYYQQDIYFYLKICHENAEIVFSDNWSDLYLKGIDSSFVKVDCYDSSNVAVYSVGKLYSY